MAGDLMSGLLPIMIPGNPVIVTDGGRLFDNTTNPGLFADPCGAQRLPNGNTIICSYGQRGATKAKIFEVTPKKKVVWEYINAKLGGAHEVHVITTGGKPIQGAPMK